MRFVTTNGRMIIEHMAPGTPAARIPRWRSRIRGAWLRQINNRDIACLADVHAEVDRATTAGERECRLVFSHPAIRHGLTNNGIPQVNVDQLNPRLMFQHKVHHPSPSSDSPVIPLQSMVKSMKDGGVFNFVSLALRLTRGKLVKQKDWPEWRDSEWTQLDQYAAQHMFGDPVPVDNDSAIFNLVWTYVVKELD